MKKIVTLSLITGISLIMLFSTVGTAQMAEVNQDSKYDESMCELLNEDLASATGWRVEYIQQVIDRECS